jgi:hypothetical protein
MFGRMVARMKQFFTIGHRHADVGGIGVMNIMLVAARSGREIGVRKAGATTGNIQRQFFRGLLPDDDERRGRIADGARNMSARQSCARAGAVRQHHCLVAGRPFALAALIVVGVATSTYPARRAAGLPPVEAALRFEM